MLFGKGLYCIYWESVSVCLAESWLKSNVWIIEVCTLINESILNLYKCRYIYIQPLSFAILFHSIFHSFEMVSSKEASVYASCSRASAHKIVEIFLLLLVSFLPAMTMDDPIMDLDWLWYHLSLCLFLR